MNQIQENYENQQMQEALDNDPEYWIWAREQEANIEEKDDTLEALIKETVELDNEHN